MKVDIQPGALNSLPISEGETKEEAMKNIKQAIQMVLEVTREQAR